jgi:hypothetical protein
MPSAISFSQAASYFWERAAERDATVCRDQEPPNQSMGRKIFSLKGRCLKISENSETLNTYFFSANPAPQMRFELH